MRSFASSAMLVHCASLSLKSFAKPAPSRRSRTASVSATLDHEKRNDGVDQKADRDHKKPVRPYVPLVEGALLKGTISPRIWIEGFREAPRRKRSNMRRI